MSSPESGRGNQEKSRLDQILTELTAKNFYARLGVTINATDNEIKSAFKKLATPYHPDGKPAQLKATYEEIFSLYSEAKSTLTNLNERKRYDAKLMYESPSAGSRSQPSAGPRASHQRAESPFDDSFFDDFAKYTGSQGFDFEDFLRNFARGRTGDARGHKPPPSPETSEQKRARVKKEIIRMIEISAKGFELTREDYVRQGIFTEKEINAWPEVREAATKSIKKKAEISAQSFELERDQWIRTRIFTLKEVNGWQEIRNSALSAILRKLSVSSKIFEQLRNEWVQTGVFSLEEINSLPQVREFAISDTKRVFSRGGFFSWQNAGEQWIEIGVLTREEVERIKNENAKTSNNKTETRIEGNLEEKTLQDIIRAVNIGVNSFKSTKDSWIKRGVAEKNIISLSEVKDEAKKHILRHLNIGPISFEAERNEWVSAGVFTKDDINNWEEVKNAGFSSLARALKIGNNTFNSEANKWIHLGVFSQTEIEQMRGKR